MAKVLIIDDDKIMCDMLSEMVHEMGHEAKDSQSLQEGLKIAASEAFDIIFLDVIMPDGNGLYAIPEIKEPPSSPEIIIITGMGDPDGAELAINNGAWDYIEKGSSIKDMRLSLKRSLEYREQKKGYKAPIALKRSGILGHSKKINACIDQLAQAASSEANVLITGETGTGKELFAQAIHENSPRSNKNFVVVDCAALPKMLVESVLFGHIKGAFTGADRAQDGLIKQAHQGTLFLDEVGELPLPVQKAFLRVLQEHCFRPVGGKLEVKSNFRLVAATNRDIDKMVKSGRFRNDLMFRLLALTIKLSPLREHPEDIKELSLYYVAKLCERDQVGTKGFSPEFFKALTAYNWPGNVRELINTLETALATARHDHTLFAKHLPIHIRIHVARTSVSKKLPAKGSTKANTVSARTLPSLRDFRMSVAAETEKRYLQDLMSSTKNNINEARRISGLSRSRLYYLLQKYKISSS